MGEYNQLKGQLTALARKAGGSLAVRDLGGILKPGDMVDTENLTTLFVVVPAHTKGEWLSAYETLSDFVVRLCLSLRRPLSSVWHDVSKAAILYLWHDVSKAA